MTTVTPDLLLTFGASSIHMVGWPAALVGYVLVFWIIYAVIAGPIAFVLWLAERPWKALSG